MIQLEECSVANIEAEIKRIKALTKKFEDLKALVAASNLYEVGIRKSDNVLCSFSFKIDYYSAECIVFYNSIGLEKEDKGKITLKEFNEGYMSYSPKIRQLFPRLK